MLLLVWLAVKSLTVMLFITVIYGFVSGGLLSLPLSVLARLTSDQSSLGARMGVFFVSEGIGVLVGTPIAGAVLGKSNGDGDWDGLRGWGAATVFVGGFLVCVSRGIVSWSRGKLWIRI